LLKYHVDGTFLLFTDNNNTLYKIGRYFVLVPRGGLHAIGDVADRTSSGSGKDSATWGEIRQQTEVPQREW